MIFKNWFERQFKPKNKNRALFFRQRLSLLYAFVGWNSFGVIFYLIMKDKLPSDPMERRKSYRQLTGTPSNMHVYQISGVTVTDDFDVEQKTKVAQVESESEMNEEAIAKTDEH